MSGLEKPISLIILVSLAIVGFDPWLGYGDFYLGQGAVQKKKNHFLLQPGLQIATNTSWGGEPATGWLPVRGS